MSSLKSKEPKGLKIGIVEKISGIDTIRVKVKNRQIHKIYKKVVNVSRAYIVHDKGNTSKVGDTVEFISTRPISKHKKWRLIRIVEKVKSMESEKTKS